MMTRLIPKIFYSSMADGLDLFVACLGFTVLYQDDKLAVIERDGAKAYLVEDAEFAAKDRPEITIETDRIDDLYSEISSRRAGDASSELKKNRKKALGRAGIRRTRQHRRLCDLSAVVMRIGSALLCMRRWFLAANESLSHSRTGSRKPISSK